MEQAAVHALEDQPHALAGAVRRRVYQADTGAAHHQGVRQQGFGEQEADDPFDRPERRQGRLRPLPIRLLENRRFPRSLRGPLGPQVGAIQPQARQSRTPQQQRDDVHVRASTLDAQGAVPEMQPRTLEADREAHHEAETCDLHLGVRGALQPAHDFAVQPLRPQRGRDVEATARGAEQDRGGDEEASGSRHGFRRRWCV